MISDDELDELLAARDPLDVTELTARRLDPVLTRLSPDFSATRRVAPTHSTPRRPRVGRRVAGLAAVGVVLAAATLAGVSLLGGGSTRSLLPTTRLPVAQAEQLNRIAQATAAGSSAGHGKWLYVSLATTEHQSLQVLRSPVVSYSVTERVQEWSASALGPTRVRITFSDFAFASARARAVYESHRMLFARSLAPLPLAPGHRAVLDATIARGVPVSPTDIGNGTNGKVPLGSLPTNPETLVRVLGHNDLRGFGFHPGPKPLNAVQRRQRQQFVVDNEAEGQWLGLAQILVASSSARQRAEAYRALALVRFVHVVGGRRDSRGRMGVAVSFHEPGPGDPTATLIVDPRTGNLLQDNTGSGSLAVWLARASVDSDTELPGGGVQTRTRTASSPFAIFRATDGGVVG